MSGLLDVLTDDAASSVRQALDDVLTERVRQVTVKGYMPSSDDARPLGDWTRTIVRLVAAADVAAEQHDVAEWSRRMTQVGAVAVAAIESFHRIQGSL